MCKTGVQVDGGGMFHHTPLSRHNSVSWPAYSKLLTFLYHVCFKQYFFVLHLLAIFIVYLLKLSLGG